MFVRISFGKSPFSAAKIVNTERLKSLHYLNGPKRGCVTEPAWDLRFLTAARYVGTSYSLHFAFDLALSHGSSAVYADALRPAARVAAGQVSTDATGRDAPFMAKSMATNRADMEDIRPTRGVAAHTGQHGRSCRDASPFHREVSRARDTQRSRTVPNSCWHLAGGFVCIMKRGSFRAVRRPAARRADNHLFGGGGYLSRLMWIIASDVSVLSISNIQTLEVSHET